MKSDSCCVKSRSVPNHFQGCGRPIPNFGSETTAANANFWEISQYSISISNIDAVNKGQLRILPSDLHHPKAIVAVFISQANYSGHTFLSGFVFLLFFCFFVFCLLPPRHLVFGWNSFNIPGLVLTIRSKALDGSST